MRTYTATSITLRDADGNEPVTGPGEFAIGIDHANGPGETVQTLVLANGSTIRYWDCDIHGTPAGQRSRTLWRFFEHCQREAAWPQRYPTPARRDGPANIKRERRRQRAERKARRGF